MKICPQCKKKYYGPWTACLNDNTALVEAEEEKPTPPIPPENESKARPPSLPLPEKSLSGDGTKSQTIPGNKDKQKDERPPLFATSNKNAPSITSTGAKSPIKFNPAPVANTISKPNPKDSPVDGNKQPPSRSEVKTLNSFAFTPSPSETSAPFIIPPNEHDRSAPDFASKDVSSPLPQEGDLSVKASPELTPSNVLAQKNANELPSISSLPPLSTDELGYQTASTLALSFQDEALEDYEEFVHPGRRRKFLIIWTALLGLIMSVIVVYLAFFSKKGDNSASSIKTTEEIQPKPDMAPLISREKEQDVSGKGTIISTVSGEENTKKNDISPLTKLSTSHPDLGPAKVKSAEKVITHQPDRNNIASITTSERPGAVNHVNAATRNKTKEYRKGNTISNKPIKSKKSRLHKTIDPFAE